MVFAHVQLLRHQKNSNIYDVFIALYGDAILCMKFYGTATTVDDLPRASSILLCLLQAKTHTKKHVKVVNDASINDPLGVGAIGKKQQR